jgi:hypothetical protein
MKNLAYNLVTPSIGICATALFIQILIAYTFVSIPTIQNQNNEFQKALRIPFSLATQEEISGINLTKLNETASLLLLNDSSKAQTS